MFTLKMLLSFFKKNCFMIEKNRIYDIIEKNSRIKGDEKWQFTMKQRKEKLQK